MYSRINRHHEASIDQESMHSEGCSLFYSNLFQLRQQKQSFRTRRVFFLLASHTVVSVHRPTWMSNLAKKLSSIFEACGIFRDAQSWKCHPLSGIMKCFYFETFFSVLGKFPFFNSKIGRLATIFKPDICKALDLKRIRVAFNRTSWTPHME